MENYPRLCIKTGLSYLLLGVTLGASMAFSPALGPQWRFVHIHLNLLGFMAFMIAGVAYHVLPRFSGNKLPWPDGVKYHFWLHNAGLLGMVSFYLAGGYPAGDGFLRAGFIASAFTAASGIACMIYNLFFILSGSPPSSAGIPAAIVTTPPPPPPFVITGEIKVGAVLDRFPHLLPAFLEAGFKALANPALRKTFAGAISIERACAKHGVDTAAFLRRLNAAAISGAVSAAPPAAGGQAQEAGGAFRRGGLCGPDVVVGELLAAYPETKAIFEQRYGEGCFSCPGQAQETVAQTARMHNLDPEEILRAVNAVIAACARPSADTPPPG